MERSGFAGRQQNLENRIAFCENKKSKLINVADEIHIPVLLHEVIEYLKCEKGKTYLDCTLGGGGHTMAIADIVCPEGKVVAIDRDINAIEYAKIRLEKFGNCVVFLNLNFACINDLPDMVSGKGFDGILFDLGFSSMQIDDARRGFSFMKEGVLDMRMDPLSGIPVSQLVNETTEVQLGKIFREYGEERWWKRIARTIVTKRQQQKITTTTELAAIVSNAVPHSARYGTIHPATRVFQALRIAVNLELENLEKALPFALGRLKKGGRLVVISYHSLEDRIVKRFFMEKSRGCVCPKDIPVCVCGKKPEIKIITKKIITPAKNEVEKNPRARSAKMRVCERLAEETGREKE